MIFLLIPSSLGYVYHICCALADKQLNNLLLSSIYFQSLKMCICVLWTAFIIVATLADYIDRTQDMMVREDIIPIASRPVIQTRLGIHNSENAVRKDDNESMNVNTRKRVGQEDVPQRILARAPPQRSPSPPASRSNTHGHTPAPAQNAVRAQSPTRSYSGSMYNREDLVGELVLANQRERVKNSRKAGLEAIRQAREHGDKADTARSASIAALHQYGMHDMGKFHDEIYKHSALEKQQINKAVQHHEQAHAATTARNKLKYAGWRNIQSLEPSNSE